MRPFQELVVWQKAHQLALAVYHESRAFLGDERFGLTSQLRRSAVSRPANLAEGSARPGEGVPAVSRHRARLCYRTRIPSESVERPRLHLRETHSRLDTSLAEVKRMLVAFIRRLPDAPPPRTTNS